MEHKLELLHEGQRRFGLRRGEVTLSLEQIAHPFSFTYAEKITASDPVKLIRRGDQVAILVDDEVLVEGYANSSMRRRSADELTFDVRARGYGQDIVDCSSMGKRHYANATVDKIVADIVKPFGVSVRAIGSMGAPLKSFKVDKTSKAFEATMRACTQRGVWPRFAPGGKLLELVRVDATPESVALVNGVNCTDLEFEENDEELFSKYVIHGRTSETEDAYGGNTRLRGEVVDPSVTRYRPLRIDSKSGGDGPSDVGLRAKIERNRRLGLSEVIRCKTDGWRDGPAASGGALWLPNQLRVCRDDHPAMAMDSPEFLLTTAKYSFDEMGKQPFASSLELKRREAFDPEASYPVTRQGAKVR